MKIKKIILVFVIAVGFYSFPSLSEVKSSDQVTSETTYKRFKKLILSSLSPEIKYKIDSGIKALTAAKQYIADSISNLSNQDGFSVSHSIQLLKQDAAIIDEQIEALKILKNVYESNPSIKADYLSISDADIKKIIEATQKLGPIPNHLMFILGQNPLLVNHHWQQILFDSGESKNTLNPEQVKSRLRQIMGSDFFKIEALDFSSPISTGVNSIDYRATYRVNLTDPIPVIVRIKLPNLEHIRNQYKNSSLAALNALNVALPSFNENQIHSNKIADNIIRIFADLHDRATLTEDNFDHEAKNLLSFQADFPGSKAWTTPKVYGLFNQHNGSVLNPTSNNIPKLKSEVMILQDLGQNTAWDISMTDPGSPKVKKALDRFIASLLFQVFITKKIHSEMHLNHIIHNDNSASGMIGINYVLNVDPAVMDNISKIYIAIINGNKDQIIDALLNHGTFQITPDRQKLGDEIDGILSKYNFKKLSLWQSIKFSPKLLDAKTHSQVVKTITESMFLLMGKYGLSLDQRYLDHYFAVLPALGTLSNLSFQLKKSEIRNSVAQGALKFIPKALWYKIKENFNNHTTTANSNSCALFYQ